MDATTDEKNFLAISRLDPSATEIITKSTNASIFTFDVIAKEWIKANIDGSLFIYRRRESPIYSIIVANRNSRNDFILPITTSIRFKYTPPYIYMYSRDGLIKSLYLFGEDECHRIFKKLMALRDQIKVEEKNSKSESENADPVFESSESKNNAEEKVVDVAENVENDKSKVENLELENGAESHEIQLKKKVKKIEEVLDLDTDEKCLSMIQDVDVFAKEIVTKSPSVSVFSFNINTDRWKDNVSGYLLIYQRLDHPFYSIMIKSSNKNLFLPITTTAMFKYVPPYIHVRKPDVNNTLVINDRSECKRIYQILLFLKKSLHSISKDVHRNLKL